VGQILSARWYCNRCGAKSDFLETQEMEADKWYAPKDWLEPAETCWTFCPNCAALWREFWARRWKLDAQPPTT
jgi:hypothetical protein